MAAVGLIGWAVILWASYVPGFGPDLPERQDLLSFSLFLIIIVAARAMAFRLWADTVVSLDSGFYIASVVCLGSVTSGRLVALALTLDSLMRLFGRERKPGTSAAASLAYVLYFGGMSGALLTSIGWLFDLDSLDVLAGASELRVTVRIIGTGIAFLGLHYALQGARAVLGGLPLGAYLRRVGLPGVVTETAVLPLAVIVVFLYHPDQPIKLALLGATYLVLNYAFNRVSQTSQMLRRRVGELETLNNTSRALAASLQLHELVDAVARETLAAIPEAQVLALAHHGEGDEVEEIVVDYYDRERETFERARIGAAGGGTSWVLANGKPLYVPDMARSDLGVELHADSGARSWMGVPLVIYGNVEGVLAIQSRQPDAFDGNLDLLEAIGSQAAVALENARLYEMAMVDGLTHLFVRRYFDKRLEEEIGRSDRFGSAFSVVIMDIDDFKRLNDTRGHIAGDRVLRGVADIVRSQMRAVDTAARYGGEEFAMILPRTNMVEALNQAERIRTLVEQYRLVGEGEGEGALISATASFGIASYPESKATSPEELLRLADRALYRAKHAGKNRVELYWADDDARKPPLSVVKGGEPLPTRKR